MVPLAPGAPTGVHPAGAAPVRSALVPVVLLATDADRLHDEVDAALGDEATTVHRVRSDVRTHNLKVNVTGDARWGIRIVDGLPSPDESAGS